jgi:hypothetical protein
MNSSNLLLLAIHAFKHGMVQEANRLFAESISCNDSTDLENKLLELSDVEEQSGLNAPTFMENQYPDAFGTTTVLSRTKSIAVVGLSDISRSLSEDSLIDEDDSLSDDLDPENPGEKILPASLSLSTIAVQTTKQDEDLQKAKTVKIRLLPRSKMPNLRTSPVTLR